jgi:hypothetical protein
MNSTTASKPRVRKTPIRKPKLTPFQEVFGVDAAVGYSGDNLVLRDENEDSPSIDLCVEELPGNCGTRVLTGFGGDSGDEGDAHGFCLLSVRVGAEFLRKGCEELEDSDVSLVLATTNDAQENAARCLEDAGFRATPFHNNNSGNECILWLKTLGQY